MTGVRWTRAEAEQAAADALRRSNAPIATNALTDARAVLDALGITDTVTVVAGHLEQVGWDSGGNWWRYSGNDPADTAEPLYRAVPS